MLGHAYICQDKISSVYSLFLQRKRLYENLNDRSKAYSAEGLDIPCIITFEVVENNKHWGISRIQLR